MPNFKIERIDDDKYKAFIRSLPCSVPDCFYSSDAAHIRTGQTAGIGQKPSDEYLNPICRIHHIEQTSWPKGEANWWMERVIKPLSIKRYQEWKLR